MGERLHLFTSDSIMGAKKINGTIIKTYDEETRDYFIQSLMESPHSSWSNSLHWAFKEMRGNQKMYGSPFLDKYLDKSTDLVGIIKELENETTALAEDDLF